MYKPLLLFLSPFPALLGSLWIMQVAQVGFSTQLQQILFAAVASAVCAFAIFASRTTVSSLPWMAIAAVALFSLFLPLVLFDSSGPQRWLELGSFRFYVAALFLPTVVFLLTHTMQHHAKANWALLFCVLFGLVLAAQPDASQVTALLVACLWPIFLSQTQPIVKLSTLIALLACTTIAWLQPDPLQPVPHVEGVLTLALSVSPIALILAICAPLVPIGALIWQARVSGEIAVYTVAIYYFAIGIFAYVGLTPMPLLGFGAAPILGFFLLVFVVRRLNKSNV